jgi:hypothetical protein
MDSVNNNNIGQNTFSSTSSNEGGFFDGLKNINISTWILIILILAFLGFNIFVYLAKGTQEIIDIFNPLLKTIFGVTIDITGKIVNVTAGGAKAVVAGTADVLESGLTTIQELTPQGAQSSINSQPINQSQPKNDTIQQSPLNKAINSAQQGQQQGQGQGQDYEANEASSSVHGSGKSGWCYIGLDRGIRACAEVGVNDTCMSGDIFPSQEICMNPNLRP